MLTLSLESKDATCVGSLCDRANSHGTRDFAGDTVLQAPFRYVQIFTSAITRFMVHSVHFKCPVDQFLMY